jgi:TonB family protein
MMINPTSQNRGAHSGPPPERAGHRLLGRTKLLRLLLAGLLAISAVTSGQETRRLRSGDPPEYPELAKRLNIRGLARVQASIAPNGSVLEVKELGGHPLLVDALGRAVKKWKYEAADKTSNIEVKFRFPSE